MKISIIGITPNIDENKEKLKNMKKKWNQIKYLLKSKKKKKRRKSSEEYDEKYVKINFNSDD